ncbi:MAG: MazG nucleotide pyrophosphohydrolase domain-containing protein [bacterium]|nr:MazG nucleotide pyrophosphohydrolase domain-containing protein [bacterium]
MEELSINTGMTSLLELISTLRGEEGCPWDRKQTPQTMRKYLLEECRELVEAIDSGDPAAVQEECGDVLFILTFLIRLYEEEGYFDLQTVCAAAHAKMVRRHPHVFGDSVLTSEEDLYRQWAAIKAEEAEEKRSKAQTQE